MSKAPELKFSVRQEGMDMVFTDPDGVEHVCRDPEDVWELLQDFTGQLLEKSLAVSGKTQEGPKKSHRQRVMDERAREKETAGGKLARQTQDKIQRTATAPKIESKPASKPARKPVPGEEDSAYARAFGRIGEAVIRKVGDVSKSSKWGRGGRVSTMKPSAGS